MTDALRLFLCDAAPAPRATAESRLEITIGRHRDEQGTTYFSVNTFDGEAGTQSGPYASRAGAMAAARRLAVKLGGEVRP